MPQLSKYEVYIFDCDGVILDSNQLKIEAMKNVLEAHFSSQEQISKCVEYFRRNFGKSRFHHVAHFLDEILKVSPEKRGQLEECILADFSKQCSSLYLAAELTPGFLEFLAHCKGKRYVASGSEQEELRGVFVQRDLLKHFDGIFGSPTPKSKLIQSILEHEETTDAVMFGDAESDMLSAHQNGIDFVFYSPFSNVKEKMLELCSFHQHIVLNDFSKVRF